MNRALDTSDPMFSEMSLKSKRKLKKPTPIPQEVRNILQCSEPTNVLEYSVRDTLEEENSLVDMDLVNFLQLDTEDDVSTSSITFYVNRCCKRREMRNRGMEF